MSSDHMVQNRRKFRSEADQSKISDIVNNLKEFELSTNYGELLPSPNVTVSTDVLQAAEQLLSMQSISTLTTHDKELLSGAPINPTCKNYFPTPPASVEFAPYSPDGFKCAAVPQNGDAESSGELCREPTIEITGNQQIFATTSEAPVNISDSEAPSVDITFSEIRRVLGDDVFNLLSSNSTDDMQKSKDEVTACANTLVRFSTDGHNVSSGSGANGENEPFGGCTPEHLSFMDVLLTDAVAGGQSSSCEEDPTGERKLKRLEFDIDPIPTDISALSGSPSKAFSSVMSIMPNFNLNLFESPPPASSKMFQRSSENRSRQQQTAKNIQTGVQTEGRKRRHSATVHSSPNARSTARKPERSHSAMQLNCQSSDWPCGSGGNLPNFVSVMGYQLPRVIPSVPTLADISHRNAAAAHFVPYVCTTDVFQTFFSSRHWDEFKNILVSNNIKPLQIPTVNRGSGYTEVLECITVAQIEFLLMSNQARRDGFAKCLKMSLSESNLTNDSRDSDSRITSQTVINVSEKMPGQLESGIKTRRGDQSDIVYVYVEGKTLPSISIGGQQFVRLVDVYCRLLANTQMISYAQLTSLKSVCNSLDIVVRKCTPNEKARMVVYANSVRSKSMHIITLEDMGILVRHEMAKLRQKNKTIGLSKKKLSVRKRSASRDGRGVGKRLRLGCDDSSSEYDGSETDSASVCSSGARSDSSVVIEEVIVGKGRSARNDDIPGKISGRLNGKKSLFYSDSKSSSRMSTPSKIGLSQRSESLDRNSVTLPSSDRFFSIDTHLNVDTSNMSGCTPNVLTPRSESSVSSEASGNTTQITTASLVAKMESIKSRIDRRTLKVGSMAPGPPRRNLQQKLKRLKKKLEKYREIQMNLALRDDGYKMALIPPVEKLESSGNSMLLRIPLPQCYVYVQAEKDLKLGATVECTAVDCRMPQCAVEIEISPPIPVTIKDMSPTPASMAAMRLLGYPVGNLYEHLCVTRTSPCILCTGCRPNKFYSVVEFISHYHGKLRPGEYMKNPRLLLVVDSLEEARFEIWNKVCERWRSWRLSFAPNPPGDMAEHYRDQYYNGTTRRQRNSPSEMSNHSNDVVVISPLTLNAEKVTADSGPSQENVSAIVRSHQLSLAGSYRSFPTKRKLVPIVEPTESKPSKRLAIVSEKISSVVAKSSLESIVGRYQMDPIRPSMFTPTSKEEKEKFFERWFNS